jgi:uncharacterized sporulation protein YeaH/YhbH (DUF444 family)|tara:strand:- start:9326 stop:9700 length:375 start_codon:yes stop_codon:yes gene_type:complete
MLTANQFHKQSGIQIEFQDFLQKMKTSFGENFMEKVNEGKVKLQEAQEALGLKVTQSSEKKIADRKNIRVRKVTPKTKSASGLKCSSCESNKNASGKKKNNTIRNIALLVAISSVVVWAVKNSK